MLGLDYIIIFLGIPSTRSVPTVDSGIKGIAGLVSILPFSASLACLHASEMAIFMVAFLN